MDFLTLWLCMRMRSGGIPKIRQIGRLAAGAALGACWSCFAFLMEYYFESVWWERWLTVLGTYFAALPLAAWAALGFGSGKRYIWNAFACIIVNWLCSGIISIWYGGGNSAGAAGALASMGALWLIGEIVMRFLRKNRSRYTYEKLVTVEYQGRQVTARGLVDSGNRLRSVSGKPVTLMGIHQAQQLFAPEIYQELLGVLQGSYTGNTKLLLIPYLSLGKEDGLLPAVISGRLTIHEECAEYREYEQAIIAVTDSVMFMRGDYAFILPPEYSG